MGAEKGSREARVQILRDDIYILDCMDVCMHVCMYACMHACMHARRHV